MNVIAWENGTQITDYPECAASPLARMVQNINDIYCGHLRQAHSEDGYLATVLCPPCSLDILDLAHRTVGTAGATLGHLWLWMADLLVGTHGVVHHLTDGDAIAYTEAAAKLAERRAAGEPIDEAVSHAAPLSAYSFASRTQRQALGIATTVVGRLPMIDTLVFDYLGLAIPVNGVHEAYGGVVSMAKSVGSAYTTVTEAIDRCCEGHPPRNPAAILEAGHRAIDSWERVTGVTAPLVVEADVIAAVDKMLVTSA